jgi:hypothetical protein
MSASKKKLTARVLGAVLGGALLVSGGGCGATMAAEHAPSSAAAMASGR